MTKHDGAAALVASAAIPRGLLSVRAQVPRGIQQMGAGVPRAGIGPGAGQDATDAELNAAVRAFIERHEREAAEMHVALNTHAQKIAAISIGAGAGGAGAGLSPGDHYEGRQAFAHYLRTGDVQAGLRPQAGMRESSGPDGGYSVPQTIDAAIQHQLVDFSPIRDWATVITLGQGAGVYSRIINRRGAQSGWVGEEEARPETAGPALGTVTPAEGEVYANASITQWLLDDSTFNMGAFITDNIIDEFGLQEGDAFVNGDGVKKPKGFLAQPVSTAGDDARPFGTLQYIPTGAAGAFVAAPNQCDVLVDLVYSVKAAYRKGQGVGWMMNSLTAGHIRKFKDSDGRYIWTEALKEGEPALLLGFPVAINEDMPDIGANSMSVAFGNFRRGYLIVDRLGTRILRDPFTNKPKVLFYCTKRVAGHVSDSRAIKLLKFAAA